MPVAHAFLVITGLDESMFITRYLGSGHADHVAQMLFELLADLYAKIRI
jgi:hypothetical protein